MLRLPLVWIDKQIWLNLEHFHSTGRLTLDVWHNTFILMQRYHSVYRKQRFFMF